MKRNSSVIEKCKERSRNAFVKIGNMAVGNSSDGGKNDIPTVAFSMWPHWWYETKMPKRRSK